MSVGHGHRQANLLVPGPKLMAILHKLLTTGGAPELLKRFQHLDLDCDIPYTAGYNVWGTTRFADREFVRALYDPGFAQQILGKPIDTGLSPDDTLECVLWHEAVEKTIIDADNAIDYYDNHDSPGGFGAHEYATCAEHEKVREKGGTPYKYENGLKPIIDYCQKKDVKKIAKDYSCAPYLDDPDENSRRLIKQFKALGVFDAFKESKDGNKYSKSSGADQCVGCVHWMRQFGGQDLSLCEDIQGLVRIDRWCEKYKAGEYQEPEQQPEAPSAPEPEQAAQPQPNAAPLTEPTPAAVPPAPAPTPQPHPDIQALSDSVSRMAGMMHDFIHKKPAKKKRTITATRDAHGNLVASVEDAPEEAQ